MRDGEREMESYREKEKGEFINTTKYVIFTKL